MSDTEYIISVKNRRQEFTEYFVDEFEGKLKWLIKILENKNEDESIVKQIISAGSDAITGSPKAVIDLLGNKLVDYIEDKKNKKTADRLCSLAYDFKKEDKQQEIRETLIEACFDIFQSFEIPFMTLTAKTGGETRAMQKLAKQAAHNVFYYYKDLENAKGLTTEIITKGAVFGFNNKSFISFNQTVIDENTKLDTAKLFNKVGLVIENKNEKLVFYRTINSKGTKYGYRRLFISELENKDEILLKCKEEKPIHEQIEKYAFALSIKNIEKDSKEMLIYLNDRDPNLMENRLVEKIENMSKAIIQELSNGIVQDLLKNIGSMEAVMNELIKKLDSTKLIEQKSQNKYNINMVDNKIGNYNATYN